jgi:hypothetical protein
MKNTNIPSFAKKDRKLLKMTEWEFIFCISISMLGGLFFGIVVPV